MILYTLASHAFDTRLRFKMGELPYRRLREKSKFRMPGRIESLSLALAARRPPRPNACHDAYSGSPEFIISPKVPLLFRQKIDGNAD